ncbi:hypothetical protein B6U99_05395, partial [Candidatus Geothermarchaeota archaeon ex4572_27]
MTAVCYVIEGEITCRSPLHIGSGERLGVVKRTRRYIPGSVLRGTFGLALLKLVCDNSAQPAKCYEGCARVKECPYPRLFGLKPPRAIFRFAYPLCECGGVLRPAPMDLYECDRGHIRATLDVRPTCTECGSPMRRLEGYYCESCGKAIREPVSILRLTRTAIDRSRLAHSEVIHEEFGLRLPPAGTLHSLEAIGEGSRFKLEVLMDAECSDLCKTVIYVLERGVPDEGLGGDRSVGLGDVEVRVREVKSVSEGELYRRASRLGYDFKLRLLSPAIAGLEPSTILEAARKAYTWAYGGGTPRLPSVKLGSLRTLTEAWSRWSLA